MTVAPHEHSFAVARGATRLVFGAVDQLTRVVEGMHATIALAPLPLGQEREDSAGGLTDSAGGLTGWIYRGIRQVNGATGAGIDLLLALLDGPALPQPQWDAVTSALNGILGDHLADDGNPLALPMRLRHLGRTLPDEPAALAGALPTAERHLIVLLHGLCMSDRQWKRRGHDHGAALARDLDATTVTVHYNSGRHVSENGRELAQQLERLVAGWPVPLEEITILGHSMGGLVARSACHYGREEEHRWRDALRSIVFLGTPHHGTPLERAGNGLQTLGQLSPYLAPLARMGRLRSAGITDLRHGNLLDEDWRGRDRFDRRDDARRPLPLPDGVNVYLMAASLGAGPGDPRNQLVGDGLVPVDSALGRHADAERVLRVPKARQWVGYGLSHFDLLDRPEVYETLLDWLAGSAGVLPGVGSIRIND